MNADIIQSRTTMLQEQMQDHGPVPLYEATLYSPPMPMGLQDSGSLINAVDYLPYTRGSRRLIPHVINPNSEPNAWQSIITPGVAKDVSGSSFSLVSLNYWSRFFDLQPVTYEGNPLHQAKPAITPPESVLVFHAKFNVSVSKITSEHFMPQDFFDLSYANVQTWEVQFYKDANSVPPGTPEPTDSTLPTSIEIYEIIATLDENGVWHPYQIA